MNVAKETEAICIISQFATKKTLREKYYHTEAKMRRLSSDTLKFFLNSLLTHCVWGLIKIIVCQSFKVHFTAVHRLIHFSTCVLLIYFHWDWTSHIFTMVYPYHKHIISIADYPCYSITTSIPVVYAKHSAWTWIQFKHNILLSDHTAQQPDKLKTK